MEIVPSALDAMFWTFDTRWQKAYQDAKTFWQKIASELPSTSRETHYGWLARLPKMREWLGERVVNNIAAREFTIRNKKYEDTFSVKAEDIEDDQMGLFAPSADMLGDAAARLPDQLLAELLEAGTSALCFDGQFFFDTDHPVNMNDASSASQVNSFPGTALSPTNYATVRAAMGAYKGDDGTPLNVSPTILMVPPALEAMGRTILHADFLSIPQNPTGATYVAGPQTNVFKDSAELVVNPWLTSTTAWYLLDASKPVRPLVWQVRTKARFDFLDKPTDPNVFLRDEYVFGARARGAAGYGLWFLAARAVA